MLFRSAVQGSEESAALLAAGVQPLPFIGYANERPAGTRGQKAKKSKPTEKAVYEQSSRNVQFNLNTARAGYPPGLAMQLPASGSAAKREKPAARNLEEYGSQNAVVEIDPKLLKSANEIYHEYFLQQLSRGSNDSAQSRPKHPSSGPSGYRQPLPETRPSDFDGGEAEQMSQDIVDPFQLLAALWSMFPLSRILRTRSPQADQPEPTAREKTDPLQATTA